MAVTGSSANHCLRRSLQREYLLPSPDRQTGGMTLVEGFGRWRGLTIWRQDLGYPREQQRLRQVCPLYWTPLG